MRTFATAGCGGAGGVHANEFTVPLGVTELTIEARGAAGKGSGSADGGDGLELTHELSVTKGDKLYFCVDEGAGAAGVGPGAAAGGGYTLVSRNADLSNPMMIAGGGGGASSNSPNAASGGPAGFPLGIAGSGSIGSTLSYGTGATSSVPGVGGTSVMPISNGENGSGRGGGSGGESMYAAGGGAGGGYFGGGGGAGSVDPVGSGGGGGGGSSFCSVSPCPYTWSSSETAQVKLTWDPTAIYKFDPVTPFGTLEVGTSSAPKPITFRNVGTETMIFIGPPMLIGDHAGDFAVSGSACSSGTLAPDATCTIDVVFTPSGAGKRTAVLIPHSSNGAGALPTVSGTAAGTIRPSRRSTTRPRSRPSRPLLP